MLKKTIIPTTKKLGKGIKKGADLEYNLRRIFVKRK